MIKIKDRIKRLRRGADYENYYTALDIGTEYIKALVVKREGRNGVVLGASKQRQDYADMQGGVPTNIQGIIDRCDRAMSQAEDMCDTIPGQAVIGIAGEQVKGFSTSITIPRSDPTLKISESELIQTLQLVQKRALREAQHAMSLELGVPDVDVKLINSAITSVRIDGHVVNDPLGFQGRTMVITIFNTFAPLTHIGALQTIASELDLELLATVAEPYAMARCAASDEVYDFGGIFIDIGGGTTDIALIRNGGIEGTRMFPIGGRVFTKKLAARFGISFADAEAVKLRHSRGELPPEHTQKVQAVLARDSEVLVEGIAITLQEMAKGDRLPTAIYLAGGGSALPEVRDQLKAFPWAEKLPFGRTPNVNVLRPVDIRGIYDSTGLLLDQQDITPMGLAFHAIQQQAEGQAPLFGLMRKVLKAMKV
ncbi:MAG TPA: cell division FtsA domain-containing protein [Candidatus Dormibacteraeota bacterium]|jgi:cell division protein FtsA|nr:cell division FtsA domain-containing protein [Candidatus Dormibacteraeota bacterium]